MWHSGTPNVSEGRRRALLCAYVQRDQPQMVYQQALVEDELYERLSAAQRSILNVTRPEPQAPLWFSTAAAEWEDDKPQPTANEEEAKL